MASLIVAGWFAVGRRRKWWRQKDLIRWLILSGPVVIMIVACSSSARAPRNWPPNPDWQQYVAAPHSRNVHPVRVVSTSGQVRDAAALTKPDSGQSATLTRTPSASGSTDIVLDYGKEVGGVPEFTVKSESGSPQMMLGYSETREYLTPGGDAGAPAGNGDPHRYDAYPITGPGRVVNRFVQGGERYEEISLQSPGSVTLRSVEIYFEPFLGTSSTFKGHFVSSSRELNRIWYDGAYTTNLIQMRRRTPGGNWRIERGVLSAQGGGLGELKTGTSWTDYTMSFRTMAEPQSGWVVRSRDPTDNYLLIMGADNGPVPNHLIEFDTTGGNPVAVASAPIPFDVKPGTWHRVSTTVRGTFLTTSIDGRRIARFNSITFPREVGHYPSGTVGFRELGAEAVFSDLKVTGPSGSLLYQNPLDKSSDLNDFVVPGENRLPVMLDGAKRDRLVWEAGLSVAGPTLMYSSYATQYLKQSLRLLGSYQLKSGFIEGVQTPSQPVNDSGLLPVKIGAYSATNSMYFVTNLADYYLYTGDTPFVRQEWPIVRRELAWNASQVGAQGLFVTDKPGEPDGANWNVESHSGAQTYYNALYYRALTDGAVLADTVGQPAIAARCRRQAAALRRTINAYLWDRSLGAYDAGTSPPDRGLVAQDANAPAVLYGIASSPQARSVLRAMNDRLATPRGDRRVSNPVPSGYVQVVSPFMGSFDLWARFHAGDTSDAMEMLSQEWGHMANSDPYSTEWERMTPNGTVSPSSTSLAHGWATGAVTALSGYVLGVLPDQAGYKTWVLQPHPGALSWAEGQVPTAHGAITVDWGHDSGAGVFTMRVLAPSSTSGEIAVPTYGHPVTVSVNGQRVWDRDRGSRYRAHRQGKYVFLEAVPGGVYEIVTHPAG